MKRGRFLWFTVLGLLWAVVMATPALAAYSAHQNDQDIKNFLAVYPSAKLHETRRLCSVPSGGSQSAKYLWQL